MDKTVHMADAAERALAIVTDVLEGNKDRAGRSSNAEVLDAFTDEVRANGLVTVTGLVSAFEGFGEGEPSVRRVGDQTVVDMPLGHETGDMKAQVAFDTLERVAGIVVISPEIL